MIRGKLDLEFHFIEVSMFTVHFYDQLKIN